MTGVVSSLSSSVLQQCAGGDTGSLRGQSLGPIPPGRFPDGKLSSHQGRIPYSVLLEHSPKWLWAFEN